MAQLADNSNLGPMWGHYLGARVWRTVNNSNLVYFKDSSNHLEKFTKTTSATIFASTNRIGTTLVWQPGTPGNWVITEPNGTQWVFDGTVAHHSYPDRVARAGLLLEIRFPDSPSDNLTLTYCDTPRILEGTCQLFYSLLAVTDGRGRMLSFEYAPASYEPEYHAPRLTSISDDEGVLTSYAYDVSGMLSTVTYRPNSASPTSRMYLYGEAGNICKDGSGNPSLPCPVSGFPKLLTGKIDESNHRFLNVTYDNRGRVTSSSHPADADKVSLAYSASNTLVTMPDGSVKTYVYGTQLFPRLVDYTVSGSGQSNLTHRTYNTSDRVYEETDPRLVVTRHGYDTYHETSRIEGLGTPSQRTVETTWDDAINRVVSRTVKNASSIVESVQKWAYNSRGQVVAVCNVDPSDSAAMAYVCSATTAPPAGAKVRRTVNAYCEASDVTAGTCPIEGLLIATNGARGTTDAGMNGLDDVTTYTYRLQDDASCATEGACTYRKGDLWKVTNALGQVTETIKYDKNGRPTRIKDANGTLTDLVYHPRGWLVDRIVRASAFGFPNANDATTHMDYDAVGNVTRVTQPDGAYLNYTYDDAHRLIRITDNFNNAIDYCPGGVGSADCLDAAGNRLVEQTKDSGGTIKRSLRRT
ncbi:MAG: RHS repeat protein, partial [Dokdonella sp.]|nr:RHS repeat protein [Dokdonella sp.]